MSTPAKRPEDWTREALDRLLAAVKAEPRVKNETANPTKGGDDQ